VWGRAGGRVGLYEQGSCDMLPWLQWCRYSEAASEGAKLGCRGCNQGGLGPMLHDAWVTELKE
jgi:hypothetical protein